MFLLPVGINMMEFQTTLTFPIQLSSSEHLVVSTYSNILPQHKMNSLPVDFYYAVIAKTAVADLLRMRQIEELTDCVDDELRRREFVVKHSDYPSAAAMQCYLNEISPIATQIAVDFKGVSYDTVKLYRAVVLDYLNSTKTLTHVSLNNVPQIDGGLSVCDASTSAFLRACTGGILVDLRLTKCVQTGECLLAIPGQLRSLHLENCTATTMDWRHLYSYVREHPELHSLTVSQDSCSDMLNMDELCPHLQNATTLRLHTSRGTKQNGYGALAQLVNLQQLAISSDGQGLSSYLCGLTEHHQLNVLHMELTDFEFTEQIAAYVRRLAKLHTIEIIIGDNVRGIVHLLKALKMMSALRNVSILPGQHWHGVDSTMPREVTAMAVLQNLPHIEHLRIELVPQKLSKLSRMPSLRSLQLCINNRWSSSGKRRRDQDADTNRFLRSICRANRMKKLRLESKGERLAVDERIVSVDFTQFSELHTLEVSMQSVEMEQFRSAAPLVKHYHEDLPPKYRVECWD